MTKHSSSATDSKENAACSRGEPASRTLQRARTRVPRDGMVAPAIAPGTKKTQVGRLKLDGRDEHRRGHGEHREQRQQNAPLTP